MPGAIVHSRAATSADVTALGEASGLRLSAYHGDHVAEQVRRALAREDVPHAVALAGLLRRDDRARERFRRGIAVSVSGLFRDPHQFELLEEALLPPLLARQPRLRAWSAGCARGEELYSLGVVLERLGALSSAHLLGTDLLEENLAEARSGRYPDFEAGPELRTAVRWEQRDLLGGPAPGRWHLILCRNVAIYLTREAKRALHETLAAALTPGGVLLLGRSERIADARAIGLEPHAPHAYRRIA